MSVGPLGLICFEEDCWGKLPLSGELEVRGVLKRHSSPPSFPCWNLLQFEVTSLYEYIPGSFPRKMVPLLSPLFIEMFLPPLAKTISRALPRGMCYRCLWSSAAVAGVAVQCMPIRGRLLQDPHCNAPWLAGNDLHFLSGWTVLFRKNAISVHLWGIYNVVLEWIPRIEKN